jgi:auxin efflux carrier family protein
LRELKISKINTHTMAQAGLFISFLAAIQASLSVLLVIFYGIVAARFKLLDSTSAKSISKICVKMFLPALLLTKIGSELHSGSVHRYLIILIWAFICHFVSFLIGIAAHLLLGMPDWITAAIMFNNTTSYPLLLIQSLDETGILKNLIVTDETTHDAIERAKSYFLVFATVSSCLTFAVGPRLIDMEHAPDLLDDKDELEDEDDEDEETEAGGRNDADAELSPTDQTHLIPSQLHRASVVSVSFFPSQPRESSSTTVIYDRRPSGISKRRWLELSDRTRWWLLFLYDFVNAPLIGAVLGAIIGLVPALHRSFFSDTAEGGIFSAWLTASLKNVGSVFVPLPVVVAGVSLYTCMQRVKSEEDNHTSGGTPWLTTIFILATRFLLWPVLSIGVIFFLAKETNVLSTDPMLWFTMMLMPTGPPAMKLITMVEVSDADEEDEHKIAKLLTVSCCTSRLYFEE